MAKIDKKILKDIYKPRDKNSKKYDFGLVLVIGGSNFYTGSPALTAMACYRAGCDLVHVISPERAAQIVASFSPNLITYPLKGDRLQEKHLPTLIELTESAKIVSEGKTAVVIGGGLGRDEETKNTVVEYLKRIDVPCVIDADAIHALARAREAIQGKSCLLTPHLYEFYILTGENLKDKSLSEKIKIVKAKARELGSVILLKASVDIIASPDNEEVNLNDMPCPTMTVGGTGDVLTGIAGAFLARGVDVFRAASAAAFLNTTAGKKASKEFGESVLATDIIETIPKVIPKLS